MDAKTVVHELVTNHPVVLFMKGTPQFPQCGFSATAVQVLRACGVTDFYSVNVLTDPDLGQGAKDYASWPTYPQLYIGGQFIGGADISREMYQSGELQTLLAKL
jgi:monothiol glutaredoxin